MPEVALFQPERLHPRGGGLPLRVARVIAQRILAGTYPADQTIPVESVLAEEFGVSRSALREAIKLLAAKGLLATRPRLGTQVRPEAEWSHLDPDVLAWRAELGVEEDFARHLAEVRRLIESEAAALAAERASPEQRHLILGAVAQMERASSLEQQVAADLAFHRHILEAAANPLLRSLGSAIWGALAQSFAASIRDLDSWKDALQRHQRVADAIAQADAPEARDAMLDIIARHAEEAAGTATSSREGDKPR